MRSCTWARQPAGPMALLCCADGSLLVMCRYVKFDTFHPAVERGLPVTRVVSRTLLQAILAEATTRLGGPNIIMNGAHVVEYKEEVHFF